MKKIYQLFLCSGFFMGTINSFAQSGPTFINSIAASNSYYWMPSSYRLSTKINITEIQNGVYFVKVVSNGKSSLQKLIVQH